MSVFLCTPVAYAAMSDNTYLADLSIVEGELTPQFRKTTLFYQIDLAEEVTRLDITAIPEDGTSTVEIVGNQGLKPGINIVSINVIAEDGMKMSYEIEVIKAGIIESSDASLRKLSIRDYALTPSFRPTLFEYFVEVADTVDMLDIVAIPSSTKAHVTITGNQDLSIGSSDITVTVIAEDDSTSQVYTITVNKMEKPDENAYSRDLEKRELISKAPWILGSLISIGIVAFVIVYRLRGRKPHATDID